MLYILCAIRLIAIKTCVLILTLLGSFTYAQDFKFVAAPIIESIKELARKHALDPQSAKPIIAIAGCSAVGKSYFTRQLYQVLKQEGVKVTVFLQDDFIHPTPVENPGIHPNFNFHGLHTMLEQILAGCEHVNKSAWNKNLPVSFTTDTVGCLWNIDCILLEGTYMLCDAVTYDFLKYSTLRIFIDAPEDDICRWMREREAIRQGPARSKQQFEKNLIWDMANYQSIIKPTQQYAHFIIHKDSNHGYTIQAAG